MGRSTGVLVALAILGLSAGSASAREATATTDLSLRAAPSSNTELLLTIPAGERVHVGACSRGWCQVKWSGSAGYSVQSGLALAGGSRAHRRKANGVEGELWPIFPPFQYRAGHYHRIEAYRKMPPYTAISPRFYRHRFFMMAQERNRYRYMPHIFRGYSDEYVDGGPIADIDVQGIAETQSSAYRD